MSDPGMHSVSMDDYNKMIELFTTNMDTVMREVNTVQGLLTQTDWTGENSDAFETHMNNEGEAFATYNDLEGNKLLDNIIAAMNDLAARLGNGPQMFPDANYKAPQLELAKSHSKAVAETMVSEKSLEIFTDQTAAGYENVVKAWETFDAEVQGHTAWMGLAADAAKTAVRQGVPVIIGNEGGEGGGGDGVRGMKGSLVNYVNEQLTIVRTDPAGAA